MENFTVKASESDEGQRLDKMLALHLPELSRARIQALLEEGRVTSGPVALKASMRVKAGDAFVVVVPPPETATPEAQEIPLDIVYEDKDLLVINKKPGMVVHPAVGNHDGTMVNALLAHCGEDLSGVGGVRRPGIVHRLDKETSGLMVVAKNDKAHQGLSEQLATRTLKRVYHAVVWGNVTPTSGRIETQMGRSKSNRQKMSVLDTGGKEAITDYAVLETFGLVATLVECRLHTGRTHQIRVHMAHKGFWLVGDPVYGKPSIGKFLKLKKTDSTLSEKLAGFPRQALHAAQLEFIHPISENKLSFTAELPQDMSGLVALLRKNTKRG